MMLHGWEDAIMCLAFPLTLSSSTKAWFNGLAEKSISCFDQLRKEFIEAFIINGRRKKDATYLLTIRQKNTENLRQYVDRFRHATLEVQDLHVSIAVAAMLHGTRSEKLQESLSLDQPTTLHDLFTRANKYISQEEVMGMLQNREYWEDNKREREHEDNADEGRERGANKIPKLGINVYRPLTESRSTILAAIEGSGLIQFPKKIGKNLGGDANAYCRYHRTHGHSTDNCHKLKNQVEKLAREGKIEKFVCGNSESKLYTPRQTNSGGD